MVMPFLVSMPVEGVVAGCWRVPAARQSVYPARCDLRVMLGGWWARVMRRGWAVDIHWVACAVCGATHAPWRQARVAVWGDVVDTVGGLRADAASAAGHRRVAMRAGLAANTVRGCV